jgi:hypothetical protein
MVSSRWSRVVDRDPAGLRQRDQHEGENGEGERRPQQHLPALDAADDLRQRSGAAAERDREDRHQHRRLGERRNGHFAARAHAAEGRADIQPRERGEEAGDREERDEDDDVGGSRQRQIDGEDRDDPREQRVPKTRYGVKRKIQEAFSASSTSLAKSLRRSRAGWSRPGVVRPCDQHLSIFTQPLNSGASAASASSWSTSRKNGQAFIAGTPAAR